jgi:hypothetical protein
MLARVKSLEEKIEVEVISAKYASGIYWVLTSPATRILDEKGNIIKKADLKVGDTVKIIYNGQVMMSYPPQIVALDIERYN